MNIREKAMVAALIGGISQYREAIIAAAALQLGIAVPQTQADVADVRVLQDKIAKDYSTLILICAAQIIGKRGTGKAKRRSRRHYRRMARKRWGRG